MNWVASPGQLRASFLRWALVCVPLIVLLGYLSGRLAQSGPQNPWFAALVTPSVYPPPLAFPIVWTLLYVLMGLALAMILAARGARARAPAVAAFLVQFALNLSWSPVFFAGHHLTGGLIVIVLLDVAVLATIVLFARVRTGAAALLVPYLLWVLFASYLNFAFLQLNPHMDGVERSGAVQRFDI